MPAVDDLKAFDVNGATLSLWVFKRKQTKAGQAPSFTGRWVGTSDPLENALKTAVLTERNRITEDSPYSLLAQPNESSALAIDTVETHAGLITEATAAELPNRKARKLKQVQNSAFYVVKLVDGDDNLLYAVTKADTSWRTAKSAAKWSAYFSDDEMGLDERPTFNISRRVDFFVVGDTILVNNKGHFESILSYKAHHHEDFGELKIEPEFLAVFSDIAAIVDHVGDNKIQLRRASAIREKGYYKNELFMTNLRANHAVYGLTLVFDTAERIVPTPETCRDVFVALLDHRLQSPFSSNIYDVPNTTPVAVG